MSDVTGPIATLPGSAHSVPAGTMCDEHSNRQAIARRQGETDSFGCEMHDLCAECLEAWRTETRQPIPGRCDWCKRNAADLRHARDYEEGTSGRVYLVCIPCLDAQRERDRQELEDYRDEWP